jgi:hypothetical protein
MVPPFENRGGCDGDAVTGQSYHRPCRIGGTAARGSRFPVPRRFVWSRGLGEALEERRGLPSDLLAGLP